MKASIVHQTSPTIRSIVALFRKTIIVWLRKGGSTQAAALAYYGILSLAPLLIIAINIAGIFFGRADIKQEVVAEVEQALSTQSAELVEKFLDATYNSYDGTFATVVSLILFLFAATNIFFHLKTALNKIWGIEYFEGQDEVLQGILKLVLDRVVAALMVLGFGLVIILLQVLSTFTSVFVSVAADLPVNTSFLLQLLNIIAFIGLSVIIISLIFRFLPDKQLPWETIRIGSLFTAVLLGFGQWAISIYAENSGIGSAYGVVGSLLLILVWIYFSFSILLFGAGFTHAYAELYGSDSEGADNPAQQPMQDDS